MENYFDKIQDYIDGLLPEEARKDFEREMAINQELREETLLQQRLNENIRKHLDAAPHIPHLTETLQELNTQYFTGNPIKKSRFRLWTISFSAAAGIALVLFLSGIFTATQFDELPELNNTITRSSVSEQQYQEAIVAFNGKNYEQSTAILEELYNKEEKSTATTTYYLALSYLGEKEYAKAAPLLEEIAAGNSVYKEDASYFAGWTRYQMGATTEAAKWLEQVTPSSNYYKKAQKLRSKIKS